MLTFTTFALGDVAHIRHNDITTMQVQFTQKYLNVKFFPAVRSPGFPGKELRFPGKGFRPDIG